MKETKAKTKKNIHPVLSKISVTYSDGATIELLSAGKGNKNLQLSTCRSHHIAWSDKHEYVAKTKGKNIASGYED